MYQSALRPKSDYGSELDSVSQVHSNDSEGEIGACVERSSVNKSDELLIKCYLQGNSQAFDMLVIKHQQSITRVVSIYIHDHEAVKDVVQDTFIKAYKGLKNFRRDSQFYTWLYRIAVNTALTDFKANKRRRCMMDFDEVFQHESQGDLTSPETPEKKVLNEELGKATKQAVERLPLSLRSSLLLREQQGMSYEQIAEVLGCRIGTVRSRISRAREHVVNATEHLYYA